MLFMRLLISTPPQFTTKPTLSLILEMLKKLKQFTVDCIFKLHFSKEMRTK